MILVQDMKKLRLKFNYWTLQFSFFVAFQKSWTLMNMFILYLSWKNCQATLTYVDCSSPTVFETFLKCKIQTINFDVFQREELFFVNSIISSMNYSSEFQAEHTWRLTELHEKNAEYLWSSRHLLLKMGWNYFWKSNLLKKNLLFYLL